MGTGKGKRGQCFMGTGSRQDRESCEGKYKSHGDRKSQGLSHGDSCCGDRESWGGVVFSFAQRTHQGQCHAW